MTNEMSRDMYEQSKRMKEMSENMSEMSERMREMSANMDEPEGDMGFPDNHGRRWRNAETMNMVDALELDDTLRETIDELCRECIDEGYGPEDAVRRVANGLYDAVEDEYDAAVEHLMDCGYQVVLDVCMTHPAFMRDVDWDAIAEALLADAGYERHE